MRLDLGTILGLVVGVGGILLGQALEGGHIGSIIQPTAAFIVFGGTIGAALVSFPLSVSIGAIKGFTQVFSHKGADPAKLIAEIVGYATKARRQGLISLDSDASKAADPFLKKALQLAVDGTDPKVLRETMEIQLATSEHHGEMNAKFFEACGGYAPTIGVVGAVLGLIHVMENLSEPSKLGAGIAVAFVATVYGVASANLFFLPAANKLKLMNQEETKIKEMILEGIISIQQGENPKVIEQKLKGYLPDHKGHKGTESEKGAKKARAAA